MSLEKIPKPVIGIICGYLNIKDRARFARTCKKHLIFMPGIKDLIKIYKNYKKIFKHMARYRDFCRICCRMIKDSNTCDLCCVSYVCDHCVNEENICKICVNSNVCSVCISAAKAVCFECKKFACYKHLNAYNNIYFCDKCE